MSGLMRAYYHRRAREYDDGWLGIGLFAPRDRPGWARERERLAAMVRDLEPVRTLDVGCGTGFLTRLMSGQVTGLDQSEEMVRIASARGVHAVVGDAVPLAFGADEFDRVFTSHFYGHLLPDEREPFLAEARRVAAETLIVVDSALRPGGVAEEWQERRLNDGSRHRVYKRWFTAAGLVDELGGGEVLFDGDWFVAVEQGVGGAAQAPILPAP